MSKKFSVKIGNEKEKKDNNDDISFFEVKPRKKQIETKQETQKAENKDTKKRKVGRPASENSGRIVTVHKTGQYSYLSVQQKKIHNGKMYYCHYHLGPLNEKNEFIPGRNYIFASADFKSGLIFPKFVKMNKLNELNEIYIKNQAILNNIVGKEKEKVKEEEFELA